VDANASETSTLRKGAYAPSYTTGVIEGLNHRVKTTPDRKTIMRLKSAM
jgi:hypothetical protein